MVTKEEPKEEPKGEPKAEPPVKMAINRRATYIFIILHIAAFYGAYYWYISPHFWRLALELVVLYFFTGMFGITAGAHRLWSHKSYKAKLPSRILMMLANSMANQKCIYKWVQIHRTHHAYADTPDDPHDINRGFWYAHMGWLLLKTPPNVKAKLKACPLRDLERDPVVMFQYKMDPWLNFFMCFVVPTLYAWYIYNNAFLGFIVLGVMRWIFILHITWTINSVAHTFGTKTYNPNIRACNSLIESIISAGEGSHNFHHQYPWDYRTSGNIIDWNPTKYFIDFLYLIGQASDLKTYSVSM